MRHGGSWGEQTVDPHGTATADSGEQGLAFERAKDDKTEFDFHGDKQLEIRDQLRGPGLRTVYVDEAVTMANEALGSPKQVVEAET